MKRHNAHLLVWFLLLINVAHSQEFGIFGKVVDRNQHPISFANILVQRTSDSSFVAGTSTDDSGNFSIIPLAKYKYTISVSFIGFTTFTDSFVLDRDKDFKAITLEESSEMLDEISITAKRPTVTKKPDRLTFNIENTALTEGSTLQVLKSTPGVIVSESGINIKNTEATVYINEKRVQLTSDELIQLLESAPANSIKSVEVITNPPASYDADSGAVVNIVMSKNLIAGYRGSVYTNYTQGVYPRYNAGMSNFFKNDKISFNLNYNYSKQKINRENDSKVNYLDTNNEVTDLWTSDINRTTWSETHNVNLNFDYEINDNNTLSLSSTALYTPYFQYNVFNNTDITDPNGNFLSRFTADNASSDDKYNIGTDLDYRHLFEDGSSLSVNAHYTTYDYQRSQNVFSEFFDEDNLFENDSEFNTLANQTTDIITSKVDYSKSFDEAYAALDFGMKYSWVQTNSAITKTDIIGGLPVLDPLNTDRFDYEEKVLAGYGNFSKSWDRWDLTLGLRVEQTNIEGVSVSNDERNTQDYFQWFPNLSLSHSLAESFSVYTNYKRSITRPNYTNLNPFSFFLNENAVVVGNPALQPTFIDHVVVGSSFLEYFTVEAYYMNYEGAINELPRQDNVTNIVSFVPVNLDKTVDFGFDFMADFYITDWWSVFALTSFYNITEETKFGDDFVSLSQWSNISILSNNLLLLEDSSLSISFNLTYGNKNLQALGLVDTLLFSDLAIAKRILKNRGVVSLSIEDLFNAQDQRITIDYLNQSSVNFTNLDNRFIKLGFRYKFGNTRLSTNERTAEMEERNRLKESAN